MADDVLLFPKVVLQLLVGVVVLVLVVASILMPLFVISMHGKVKEMLKILRRIETLKEYQINHTKR